VSVTECCWTVTEGARQLGDAPTRAVGRVLHVQKRVSVPGQIRFRVGKQAEVGYKERLSGAGAEKHESAGFSLGR